MTFLPAEMLLFLIGKIVPVPSIRSCLGRLFTMSSGSRRLKSLAVPCSQMGASVTFGSFQSDGCFTALTGVVLRD